MNYGNKACVTASVKIDAYRVISEAVETGVTYGLRRADKHAEIPLVEEQRERVASHIHSEVMNALTEVLIFP
jgi:hypothetical protein